MSEDVLEQVKLLPPDKQQEVKDFIGYLVSKYSISEQQEGESLAEVRRKNMGWAKGQICMANDFNETPEDFKDYM